MALDFGPGVSELSSLKTTEDTALLANTKERYDAGHIYTRSGRLLLAVNPYRQLPLYTDEVLQYRCRHTCTRCMREMQCINWFTNARGCWPWLAQGLRLASSWWRKLRMLFGHGCRRRLDGAADLLDLRVERVEGGRVRLVCEMDELLDLA